MSDLINCLTESATVPSGGGTAIEAAKAAIGPVLAAHGIASVVIAYDGYGDEGQIESITALDAAGAERPLPVVPCLRYDSRFDDGVTQTPATLGDALDTLGYEVLALLFSGWENNEGALGSIRFDVASRGITVEHDWRVTALERDERTL